MAKIAGQKIQPLSEEVRTIQQQVKFCLTRFVLPTCAMVLIWNPISFASNRKTLHKCRNVDSYLADGQAASRDGWQSIVFSVTYVLAPALLIPVVSLNQLKLS